MVDFGFTLERPGKLLKNPIPDELSSLPSPPMN